MAVGRKLRQRQDAQIKNDYDDGSAIKEALMISTDKELHLSIRITNGNDSLCENIQNCTLKINFCCSKYIYDRCTVVLKRDQTDSTFRVTRLQL